MDFGLNMPAGRKRRRSSKSDSETSCKKCKDSQSLLETTIGNYRAIIACLQLFIAAAYQPFTIDEGFFCRVPNCNSGFFARQDSLLKHIRMSKDPIHTALTAIIDQGYCMECRACYMSGRGLTRHDNESHHKNGLRIDRVLGGESWDRGTSNPDQLCVLWGVLIFIFSIGAYFMRLG
jgi:hypothetical protein